jgi:hypothetical protein
VDAVSVVSQAHWSEAHPRRRSRRGRRPLVRR